MLSFGTKLDLIESNYMKSWTNSLLLSLSQLELSIASFYKQHRRLSRLLSFPKILIATRSNSKRNHPKPKLAHLQIKDKNKPRSPPRLAELQSETRVATSSKLALPETISSRIDLSCSTAASLVVVIIILPSGSFHDAFLRDPWCLIKMCDALTWSLDAILLFFRCLLWWWWWWSSFFSFAVRSVEETESFFRFRSESIFVDFGCGSLFNSLFWLYPNNWRLQLWLCETRFYITHGLCGYVF